MNLTSILGFVSLAGWLMLVGGAALAISNAAQNRTARPGVALALVGLVIGVFFFIASSGLIQVGATEVAVVFQSVGGDPKTSSLWPEPLGPGVHIIIPIINEPNIYSTEIRTYTMSRTANEGQRSGDDSVAVRTKDGQQVYIDVSILYRIDPAKANLIHLKFKNRYEEDFIRPTVRSAVRDVVSGYNVEALYGEQRTEIQDKIYQYVLARFPENGLQLQPNGLLLRNITFSDEFIKAVEQKQVAQQQAEQAKQEAERARTIAKGAADAVVTKAEGDAKAVIANANGEAEAIRLRAGAEAKALELINEQLSKNPMLIQWQYVQKLAGNITLALVPSNTPFLFDINALLNANKVPSPAPTSQATKP